MAFNLNDLVLTAYTPNTIDPPQVPVTILDLERIENDGCVDMLLPMVDPCPNYGAYRMLVGNWICCDMCEVCYDNLTKSE